MTTPRKPAAKRATAMTNDQEAALSDWRTYCADLEQIGASLIEHDQPQSAGKTLLNTFAARIALDSPTTTRDNLPERSALVRRRLADAIILACSDMDPRTSYADPPPGAPSTSSPKPSPSPLLS
jgi:hypothetical protein